MSKQLKLYKSLKPGYRRKTIKLNNNNRLAVHLARLLRYNIEGVRDIRPSTRDKYIRFINKWWPYPDKHPLDIPVNLNKMLNKNSETSLLSNYGVTIAS